jgi:hypothetical protein
VAGLLLDWARPRGQTGAVLSALQVAAAVAGLVTTALLMRQHEPVPHLRAAPPPFVRSGLRPFRDPSGLLGSSRRRACHTMPHGFVRRDRLAAP